MHLFEKRCAEAGRLFDLQPAPSRENLVFAFAYWSIRFLAEIVLKSPLECRRFCLRFASGSASVPHRVDVNPDHVADSCGQAETASRNNSRTCMDLFREFHRIK